MLSQKPWTLEAMIRLMLAVLATVGTVSIAAGLIERLRGHKFEDESPLSLAIGTLVLECLLLLLVWLFLWFERTSWTEAFGFKSTPLSHVLFLGIIAALVFFPVGMTLEHFCESIMNHFKVVVQERRAVEILRTAESGWSRICLIFVAVLVAPITEETLFRGILYPTIKQCGLPRVALWGNSLLFALIHNNPARFVPLTVLALMLTLLYERTNNLLTSIVAHSSFNALNVVLLYVIQSQPHAT